MKAFNLTLRFLLELCAFGALGYAGWRIGGPIWLSTAGAVVLGVGGAAIWGMWVAPRASYPLRDPLRLIPEWVVFGGATVALAVTGHPILATALAVLAALNRIALWRLGVGTGGETPPAENAPPQPTTDAGPLSTKDAVRQPTENAGPPPTTDAAARPAEEPGDGDASPPRTEGEAG